MNEYEKGLSVKVLRFSVNQSSFGHFGPTCELEKFKKKYVC